mmetsp:Transcript_3844/g.8271  ORF Transcript_3844/g.8271 Transcript_3844/m.8271 type:complete len:248 (+) Transcript_3844:427-1170(+)
MTSSVVRRIASPDRRPPVGRAPAAPSSWRLSCNRMASASSSLLRSPLPSRSISGMLTRAANGSVSRTTDTSAGSASARARASFAFFIGPPCMPSTTRLPMAVTALREVVLRDLVAAVAHWARAFFASRRSFKTGAPALPLPPLPTTSPTSTWAPLLPPFFLMNAAALEQQQQHSTRTRRVLISRRTEENWGAPVAGAVHATDGPMALGSACSAAVQPRHRAASYSAWWLQQTYHLEYHEVNAWSSSE